MATRDEQTSRTSVLCLVATSFRASIELASTVNYGADKDAARHQRNVLLRRALRWKLNLLRFVDVNFIISALQPGMMKEKEAVSELGGVVSLCRWCAKWKEPIPNHARNLFIVVLGAVVSTLLSQRREEDASGSSEDQSLQVQVKAAISAVLGHLLQSFPPGPCSFLVHCQGILMKYSVKRSAEVCGVLKEAIGSDEHLAVLHAQVTAQGVAAHTSLTLSVPTATSTPSTKRPAATMNAHGSALNSLQDSAVHSANDVTKKPRRPRTVDDNSADRALATPQSQQLKGRPHNAVKTEVHHTPASTLRTPETGISAMEPGSGAHMYHAQTSKLRDNKSFLSAIMEVPTVTSPQASTPKTGPGVSVSQTLTPLPSGQSSTSANFDFAPGSAAKGAMSSRAQTEPGSRPNVVAHISKKFGGGF